MTLMDYASKDLPENYYSTMYMDGYTPEEILMTAHRSFIYEAEEYQEEDSFENVQITSEVKVKK